AETTRQPEFAGLNSLTTRGRDPFVSAQGWRKDSARVPRGAGRPGPGGGDWPAGGPSQGPDEIRSRSLVSIRVTMTVTRATALIAAFHRSLLSTHEQPLVEPQFSHLWQVPFLIIRKPQFAHGGASGVEL